MTAIHDHRAASAAPRQDRAGAFLGSLAAQDFAQLGGTLAAGARMRALLPSDVKEWAGSGEITRVFARWFGDTQDFELIEATTGEVVGLLYLRWRLRLRAERLGTGWFTVEQQAYADTGDDGRICRLDLLCTGYLPEGDDG